jgi:hypothetical protein
LRVLNKEGKPGALDFYENIVRINLIGSFDAASLPRSYPMGTGSSSTRTRGRTTCPRTYAHVLGEG